MNLKEAFRFQNKLQSLMELSISYLYDERNSTKVERTHLRKKAMPEAENETSFDLPADQCAEHLTELADFLLYLLKERESLSAAVRAAKNALPMDMDSEVSLNSKRQEVAKLFQHMCGLRNSEVIIPDGGTGYRFNAEGNQVSYLCDLKLVTTINFDRKKIRAHAAALNRRADAVSAELDACLVNSSVGYNPPFDVNESFEDVFEAFLEGKL